MTRQSVWVLTIAAALALSPVPEARACGHCREDKIAATYDDAVISAARRNGQTVVFAELHGSIEPTSKLRSWIRQQVEASARVVRGTARVSLEPAAISFACEPSAVSTTMRAIGQKLALRGLSVSLIEAQASTPPKTIVRS